MMSTNWQNVRSSVPRNKNVWAHQNNIQYGSRYKEQIPDQSQSTSRTILQNYHTQNNYNKNYSIRLNKNTEEEYRTTKPLERGLNQPKPGGFVVFKGMPVRTTLNKLFKPVSEDVSSITKDTALRIVRSLDSSLESSYTEYITDFIQEVTKNPKFREFINISDDAAKSLSEDSLLSLPKMNFVHRLAETVISPVTGLTKAIYRFTFKNTDAVKEAKRLENIEKNYQKALDLFDNAEFYEKRFRASHKITPRNPEEEFLIPEEELKDKLTRRCFKSFNPKMGQYSTKVLGPGNRIISGLIGASYLSNDAYNTTMHLTGERDKSVKERRSRFFQETTRIALSAYLMGIGLSLFKKSADRSMLAALGVTGAVTFLSEVMGRKLVGKAVLPSDKETLDKMEEKRKTAKGILPAIGRFITGEKVEKLYNNTIRKITLSSTQINKRFDTNTTFLNFTRNSKTISFTGGIPLKVNNTFNSKELGHLIELMDNINPEMGKHTREIIEKGLKKVGKFANKDISNMSFDQAIKELKEVPVGSKGTTAQMISKTLGAPYHWIKGWIKGLKDLIVSSKNKLNKVTDDELLDNVKKRLKPEMKDKFEEFANIRRAMPYWQKSKLSEKQKEVALIKEFLKNNTTNLDEEIEGTKNTLLWLRKTFDYTTKKNISLEDFIKDIKQGGTKYSKELDAIKGKIEAQKLKAFSQGNTEYNTSKFSVINVNVARGITTGFLVTDAYNLTMQHSNNNSAESITNGKKRAIQEAARITVSAYIMNFFHTWWSKFINASLLGAFTTTAVTSNLNEISSRGVVGIPITPKTQEELDKIADKIQNSKNPVRKTLQYLIGKRSKFQKKTKQTNEAAQQKASNTTFSSQKLGTITSTNAFIKGYIQKVQAR